VYSQSLLITGIAYEATKRDALVRGRIVCDRALQRLNAALEAYDRKHYQMTPCTGDIMCERIGARHKTGCIGRTVPINAYVKALR
jgi:hypothetical protein